MMSLIDTVLRAMGLKSDRQSARGAVEAVAIWLRVKGHEDAAHDLTLEVVRDEGDETTL